MAGAGIAPFPAIAAGHECARKPLKNLQVRTEDAVHLVCNRRANCVVEINWGHLDPPIAVNRQQHISSIDVRRKRLLVLSAYGVRRTLRHELLSKNGSRLGTLRRAEFIEHRVVHEVDQSAFTGGSSAYVVGAPSP